MKNDKDAFHHRTVRRDLYIGENVRAFFLTGAGTGVAGKIISLSESGVGFACDPKFGDEIRIGDVYSLRIYYDPKNSFVTPVEVQNKSEFQSNNVSYIRLGMAARREEPNTQSSIEDSLPNLIRLGKTELGFVEIENPIFFEEKRYFKIRAVHPKGIVLESLDNRHFLLPCQPVIARFNLPGVASFQEHLIVRGTLPNQSKWANEYLMLDFVNISDKLLMKFSISILIQEPTISVRRLQTSGFPIPFLDFIFNVEYSDKNTLDEFQANFKSSGIAPVRPVSKASVLNARTLSVYRHDFLIATMKLNFVKELGKNSVLEPYAAFGKSFHKRSIVELLEFRHHPDYPLPSILIPILQHCILSSIQAKFDFLVLECSAETEAVFEKLGFISLTKKEGTPSDGNFVALSINKGIYNMSTGVHRDTWEKVYKKLHTFLSRKNATIE